MSRDDIHIISKVEELGDSEILVCESDSEFFTLGKGSEIGGKKMTCAISMTKDQVRALSAKMNMWLLKLDT